MSLLLPAFNFGILKYNSYRCQNGLSSTGWNYIETPSVHLVLRVIKTFEYGLAL